MTNALQRVGFCFIFLLMCVFSAYGQHIGVLEGRPSNSWIKVENDQLIWWLSGRVTDSSKDQIVIAGKQGNKSLGLNILSLVPEATSVSIWDVSVRPQQLIAVSAVYAKGAGVRPAAVLLLFNSRGNLLSALALEPSRQIEALNIDENLNIWTLTTHSDEQAPSVVPMVVEYDRNGTVVRQVLSRDQFPMHANSNQVNPEIGSIVSGYDAGIFWFWLPGSTDMVTVRTSDGTVARTQTNLPEAPKDQHFVPLLIAKESSGALIAEVSERGQNLKHHVGYYSWSPETKTWSAFSPDVCAGHRLVGINANEHVYVRGADNDICTYERPLNAASK
jgi:hypothetical protein